ncbi:hypothetical protein [Bacillus sp. FJAT-27245]|uniref:hypothetical protein n=1 Tax=Bacillus sp. FJAT-27245 TaxID=1684144 RepID=UPI0006A7D092|nr:hypothetical protein [Bacillus sp. FJAT-27245]
MKKVFILSTLLVLALVGCTKETSSVNEKNKATQEKAVSTTSAESENKLGKADPDQTTSTSPGTDGKWVQLGHRLYYVQGIVESIQKNKDGKDVLNLLVEKTYQSEADGVVSPYKNGNIYPFVIKNDLPDMELNKQRVIIYGGQVTSNGQDNFIGGMVLYYQQKDQFIDFNGKPASIPPNDYPYEF